MGGCYFKNLKKSPKWKKDLDILISAFVDDEGDDFNESTLSVETLSWTQVQMLGPTLVPSVSSIVRTVIVTSEKRSRLTIREAR